MLTLEYDENIAREVEREEARQEERENLIKNCLKKGKSCEVVADLLDVPLQEVQEIKKNM